MRKPMLFLLIPALVMAVGMIPLVAGAQKKEARPSVEKLVDFFDTIIFQTEFKTGKPSLIVKKWTGPLRIALRSFKEETVTENGVEVLRLRQVQVRKPLVRFIKKHLNSLVRATGLKTEDSKKTDEPPNFMINFVSRSQMANPYLVAKADPKLLRKLAAQGGCFFLMWADNKTGNITKAVVVVNAERLLIRINHCLLEEMTQSLGLPNDSNKITPSIFSDRSRRTELTRSDQILLQTLYDSRMKVGMPQWQALDLARVIIDELDAALP